MFHPWGTFTVAIRDAALIPGEISNHAGSAVSGTGDGAPVLRYTE